MADTTQTRRIVIKVDTSGAIGLDQTAKQLEKLNKTTSDLSGGMTTLTRIFKGLAIAFVATELKDFIAGVIQSGTELKNMSQAVGISVEDLAKLKVSAELSGVPMQNLTVALRRLNTNIIQGVTGNEQISASFKALGLSASDINPKFKSTTDVLLTMADRFKNLADGPAKSALAIKIFGRAGSDIIPLLNLGSDAILKFGLHIDTEFATHAKEFTNNVQLMKLELRNLALDGFGAVLPILNEAIEKWDSFGNTNIEITAKSRAFAGIMTLLGIAAKTLTAIFGELIDIVWTRFRELSGIALGVFTTIYTGFREFLDRLHSLSKGDFSDAFSINSSKTVDTFKGLYNSLEKDQEAFADRSKKRFYDVMLFSKDLEDTFEFGPKKSPAEKLKPQVDASEINKRLTHERELLAILIDQGKEQGQLGELELRKYQLSTLDYENEKDRYKTQLEIQKATKSFDLSVPKERALAKQYKHEAELQEQLREANRKDLDDQNRGVAGVATGATEAFKTYIDTATNTAEQTKAVFTDAFKHMEDGIVDFTKTGKFSFASFTSAVLDDIIRIQVRMALAGLLGSVSSYFGFGPTATPAPAPDAGFAPNLAANGGIMTSNGMMPLNKYSFGGIANSPQMAIFGEGRTPEAYVPLPDGKNIPVKMSGGGSTYVEVNVNMADGTSSSKADSAQAERLGKAISAAVKTEIMNQRRDGGISA